MVILSYRSIERLQLDRRQRQSITSPGGSSRPRFLPQVALLLLFDKFFQSFRWSREVKTCIFKRTPPCIYTKIAYMNRAFQWWNMKTTILISTQNIMILIHTLIAMVNRLWIRLKLKISNFESDPRFTIVALVQKSKLVIFFAVFAASVFGASLQKIIFFQNNMHWNHWYFWVF